MMVSTAALEVFRKCTAHIPSHRPVAVAVSGGCDSLALTVLATKLFHRVTALIVDHKLRAESSAEAERASELVRSLGAQPHTLTLDWSDVGGPPSQGKVQTLARVKRYKALLQQCQSLGLDTIMLGHHRGDQHENFLHRFAMGSGIEGLSGMHPVTMWPDYRDVNILRPFLTLYKADLVTVCRGEGVEWVEDPTNQTALYTRNHYRQLLEEDPQLLESVQTLTELCHSTNELIAQQVRSRVVSMVTVDARYGYLTVNLPKLLSVSRPVAKRSLTTLVRYIAGNPNFHIRYIALERFYQSLLKYDGKAFSFGNALVAPIDEDNHSTLGIYQSLNQEESKRQRRAIEPGQTLLWQNRWEIQLTAQASSRQKNEQYFITNMVKGHYQFATRGIRRVRATLLPPVRARSGLPVITDCNGKVLLIPHFKFIERNTAVRVEVAYKPKYSLEDVLSNNNY